MKKRVRPLLLHKSQGKVFFDDSRFKVLACGRRWGKALDINTPILTTKGWKTMETIKEGDFVYSPTGKPTEVKAVSPIYEDRPCYELKFSDGEAIVADADHQWRIWEKPQRDAIRRKGRGINWAGDNAGELFHTDEFFNNFLSKDVMSYWAIPATAPLKSEKRKLPIDPYVFGVWLGADANRKGNFLKLKYPETKASLEERGYELRYKGVKYDWYCRLLRKELQELGFIDLDHIPEYYLNSSLSDRVALLQGIIEGTGFHYTNNKLQIRCKHKGICRDIVSLFYSLGQTLEVKYEPYQARKKKQDFYRLVFRPCQGLVATRYRRINNKLTEKSKFDDRWRFVRDVRPVKSRPVRCIQVANSTGMFCAGRTLVPTHNSRLLLTKAVSAAVNFKDDYDPLSPPYVLIAMPELKQARSIHWNPLLNLLDGHPAVKKIYKSDFRVTLKGQKPDIILRGTNENNGDSLRGLKLYFAGVDEFQDVKKSVWDNVIRPALADTKGSQALITGTPKGKTSFFYELFSNAPDWEGWNSFTFYTSDNPFIDRDEIESAREMLPPRIFRQEFEASFEDFPGKIYTELGERHLVKDENLPEFDEHAIAVDWGDINPAIVVAGIKRDPDLGDTYYIIDTWLNPNPKDAVPQEEHTREIIARAKKYDTEVGYADPSQPGRILSSRRGGMRYLKAGYNRISEGNGIVNTLLSQNRLFIAESCKDFYHEMEAYHRKEKDGQILEEVARDQDDHRCDATRYLLATREHKRIYQILNPQSVRAQVGNGNSLYSDDVLPWEKN